MLDITKVQSTNRVTITGILNELTIEEKVSQRTGKEYVSGEAKIRVDQEINGKVVENEIPVRMFAMKKKKDKTDNPVYEGIVKMQEEFTSASAAETPSQISKVTITSGQVQENSFLDKSTNQIRSSFQIGSNFMRKAKADEDQQAKFELSGVIGNITEEMDKEGNETGRLIVKFIVIGYLGRAEVVSLIAESPMAVNHIRSNWEKGDTVALTGVVNMSYKTVVYYEEQGFGEPIKRTKIESKRELLITGGSGCGLDEEYSYDGDAIRLALDKRNERLAELANPKPAVTASTNKNQDFGF